MAAMDSRGRLTDRSIPRRLGWTPDSELDIVEHEGLMLIRQSGLERLINRNGYLYLPSRIRRAAGITSGERVLLAPT
ncbi:hypothetical protein [Nocardia sp. NPDC050710]|uniref:hypothetical protein n=1 Tax=Nocardia sp. NPDC050710 TaxID=3157220 RepID=UPI003407B4C8